MRAIARWGAWIAALASLAFLGWRARKPWIEEQAATREIGLWTPGLGPTRPARYRTQWALPDATQAPAGVGRAPDVAFLRRLYPALRRVDLVGDGVGPGDADALRGIDVTWSRPAMGPGVAIVSISAPRMLAFGEKMRVQGRVRGLPADGSVTLSLEGPGGAVESTELRASSGGETGFAIDGAAPVASGAFEWTLRLGAKEQPLTFGAVVKRRELPRVLLLMASPSVETARLQRWLVDSGGSVTSRTRVSAEHMRFSAAGGTPGEFARIDAELLKAFDVIVASEPALLELTTDERVALETAVRENRVGVLVIGDAVQEARRELFLLPWSLPEAAGSDGADDTRLVRLRLADGGELAEPGTTLARELPTVPLSASLARDAQDRIVSAVVLRGRGRVARSLVVDTWRWLQGGHADVFATYWSAVLSAISAPPAGGRWRIENASQFLFACEPVTLVWTGEGASVPPDAWVVGGAANANRESLALTKAAEDPTRFTGTFWPAQAGWHDVRNASGASLSFYVQPRNALAELQAERRRAVTSRLADRSAHAENLRPEDDFDRDIRRGRTVEWGTFAVFLLSVAVLFLDTRRSSVASLPTAGR